MLNNSFWPGLFAFFSVFLATMVLIEFGIYVASRYRERFLEEASTELDDVLIQTDITTSSMVSFNVSVDASTAHAAASRMSAPLAAEH